MLIDFLSLRIQFVYRKLLVFNLGKIYSITHYSIGIWCMMIYQPGVTVGGHEYVR